MIYLAEVTSVSPEEVDPRSVDVDPAGVEAIWEGAQLLYRSGVHPALQLCVRRHGEVILDRALGHTRGNGPSDPPNARRVRATPETPFNIFSASKAITATVVHLLVERGEIDLDERACAYIPEFAARGKDRITIRNLLSHHAGIPALPAVRFRGTW
jgi:CubicO group peptidase (beta-lactamase class C family)